MKEKRSIIKKVKGRRTVDGAGVNLVRVLGNETAEAFDPILMLDSFDSLNPDDYIAGFPMHPHRGIETITFLKEGKMNHRDSLGNEDMVDGGSVQWMTAGSGILHEEEIPPSDRMLGVQIWLNMPSEYKMSDPGYYNIKKCDIPVINIDGGYIRVVSGEYKGVRGFESKFTPLDFYHLNLKKGKKLAMDDISKSFLMVFTLQGNVLANGYNIEEKTAVKFSKRGIVDFEAVSDSDLLILASEPLKEDIFWGGPVVMDSRKGLEDAFIELRNGTFIKKKIDY